MIFSFICHSQIIILNHTRLSLRKIFNSFQGIFHVAWISNRHCVLILLLYWLFLYLMHVRRYSPKTSDFFMFFEGRRPFICFQPIRLQMGVPCQEKWWRQKLRLRHNMAHPIVLSGSGPIDRAIWLKLMPSQRGSWQHLASTKSKQEGNTHT